MNPIDLRETAQTLHGSPEARDRAIVQHRLRKFSKSALPTADEATKNPALRWGLWRPYSDWNSLAALHSCSNLRDERVLTEAQPKEYKFAENRIAASFSNSPKHQGGTSHFGSLMIQNANRAHLRLGRCANCSCCENGLAELQGESVLASQAWSAQVKPDALNVPS